MGTFQSHVVPSPSVLSCRKHQLYESAQLASIVTQKDPPHPPASGSKK